MNGPLDQYTNEFVKRIEATGKKEIKAHGYLIDEGILSWDNFFVPIKHVVIVSKYVDKKVSIGSAILIIVLGMLLMAMPSGLKILGVMFLLCGIILLVLLMIIAKQRRFYVKIKLVSGDIFTIGDRDEQFIDKIIEVLRDAVVNDSAKYSISMDARTIQYYQNNGVISSGDSNWITTYSAGEEKTLNNSTDTKTSDAPIENTKTAEETGKITNIEWSQLNSYIERIMSGVDDTEVFYKALKQLHMASSEKDKEKALEAVREMGKDNFNKFFIYARSDEEKKAIIQIIKKIIR